MLRSVVTRPRCLPFKSLPCHWTRNVSTSKHTHPNAITRPSKPRIHWPYYARKRILPYRPWLRFMAWFSPYVLATFLILHIETTYFYAFDLTQGISMLPTMNATGDSVIISKLYRRGKGVGVGDMVSFDHPVDQGVQSIKRIVGMEGDWVCRDTPGVGRGTVVQVPQGHCWVVGDNLTWSRDSRLFGPLPMALIKGKVIARYRIWPHWYKLWADFEWLENALQPAGEDDDVD